MKDEDLEVLTALAVLVAGHVLFVAVLWRLGCL